MPLSALVYIACMVFSGMDAVERLWEASVDHRVGIE